MAVIVPERKVWSRQPQDALELKPEYTNLFTSLSVLSLPPRLGYDSAKNKFLPFTKSGSVTDSNPTAFGIGPKASGTTSDYYSRTVSVTSQAMWMIAVFVPTTVNTTPKVNYSLGSAAASLGAYIGITSGNGTQSNVLCQFRGLDAATTLINKLGPVPVVGKMMSVVFVCPSILTSTSYMYVDGLFYNTTTAGDGDTTFTTTLVNESIGALKRGAVANPSTDTVLLVGYGLGQIPAALAQKLSENPWQLFAPRKTLFYFPGVTSPTFGFERKAWSRQPESVSSASNPSVFLYNTTSDATRTYIGTVTKTYLSSGIAETCSGTGNRIDFSRNISPASPTQAFIVINFKVNSLASAARLIVTHSSTNYAGLDVQITAAGAIAIDYGDNGGAAASNRRSLISGTGIVSTNIEYTLTIGFTSSTTGICFLNGTSIALTASGTAATYSVGSGVGMLHSLFNSGSYVYGNQTINLAALFYRQINAIEAKSLSENPWQLFAPRRQLLYVSATSVTLTYLRPSADVSTGSWTPSTGTTLYGVLDEVVPDDADYIQASTATGCEISLSAGTTPPSRDNHTLKYRLLAGSGTIDVVLKCGTTTIKSWSHTLTGSLQDISQSLTNAEATNITDYSNLRVTFTSS